MRPVHKELAEPVARGLLGAATVDGGPTDEQRHIIDAIVHGYFDVAIEFSSLEPLDPAGLAGAVDDPKARHRMVELMIVLEFSRHPGSDAMAQRVQEYAAARGNVPGRPNGVMVSMTTGTVNAFALNNLQERGVMFVSPQDPVYEGQIVAENSRDNDMVVNPTTAKQLTNMRTTSSDENIILKPARKMTLEQALEYIEEDELVEATPQSIRLRKELLTENARKKAGRSKAAETVEV